MSESFLIRDVFNKTIVKTIAQQIIKVHPQFDEKGFLASTLTELESQTYSERKKSITNALIEYLPVDYNKSVEILLKVLPPPYQKDSIEGAMDRFYISSFTAYISEKGIHDFDVSMRALYKITQCFTSEWDVRPFILKYPEKSFALLKKWATDSNPHVRRLVSEGSRPNLPWGKRLIIVNESPEETTLPILDILQNDSSEYVRRSVANHLNDLSKDHGDLIVSRLKEWSKLNPTPKKQKMITHALRTLIKGGHLGALDLMGYNQNFKLDCQINSFTKSVNWSGKFSFEVIINNLKSESKPLLIDYCIQFRKKDGKLSDKVFKLTKATIPAKGQLTLSKTFSFKPITTRTYYAGTHGFYLQVNGKTLVSQTFELLKP